MVKNLPANTGDIRDTDLIPGLRRSPGGGHGNSFQYSCLENRWTEKPGKLQSIGSPRVGGPLPGPETGLLSKFRNGLSEETHVLTKQEILLGKGTRVESRRVRESRRTALPRGSQSQVLW